MSSYKKIIVDTMKKLYSNKLISIRDGNVSFKPKGQNYFYISAGQVKKSEINSDQIVQVHFKQKPSIMLDSEDNYILSYDKSKLYSPSREIYMHSYLQTMTTNFFSDIFVVHAHPPNIIAYTGVHSKSNELSNIKYAFPELNVGNIGRNVKYHHAGSRELAKDCYCKLKDHDIVALEKHGSLSIGTDIDEIFENLETLEYYTDIELKSKEL